jgi:hypothetical protein
MRRRRGVLVGGRVFRGGGLSSVVLGTSYVSLPFFPTNLPFLPFCPGEEEDENK